MKTKLYCSASLTILPDQVKFWTEQAAINSLILTRVEYYSSFSHFCLSRLNSINETTFLCCFSGRGTICIETTGYTLAFGTYIIIPPNVSVSCNADFEDPWEIGIVCVKGLFADSFLSRLSPSLQHKPNTAPCWNQLFIKFTDLHNTVTDYNNKQFSLNLYFSVLRFLEICIPIVRNNPKPQIEKEAMDKVLKFLRANVGRVLSIDEINAVSLISSKKLIALFKERFDCSPIEYFNLLKIQKACHLFNNSKLRVNEVGREVGLNDPFYFSRLFHLCTGMSPKKYKSQSEPNVALK